VGINGFAAVSQSDVSVWPTTEPELQAEVPGIRIGPRSVDVTLVGAPVANEVVAYFDYTAPLVSRGPYAACDCSPEFPDITFYLPGEPDEPLPQLVLYLDRFEPITPVPSDGATLGDLYLMRDVAFRNTVGSESHVVTDYQYVDEPFSFFFDTGTNHTIINTRMAASLGITQASSPDFDCYGAGSGAGYTIDEIAMYGAAGPYGGSFTVESASVCVDWANNKIITFIPDSSDPSGKRKVDAVIGSNLMMHIPMVFNGKYNFLGIVGNP
jgi:hypothetical protein